MYVGPMVHILIQQVVASGLVEVKEKGHFF